MYGTPQVPLDPKKPQVILERRVKEDCKGSPRLHGGSGENLAAKETLVRRTQWNQRGRVQALPPPGAPRAS